MSAYDSHSWNCPNNDCGLTHETYGSDTDAASSNYRECAATEHGGCVCCVIQCQECEAAICRTHAVDICGDLFCPSCALKTADDWQEGAQGAIQDAILLRDRAEKAMCAA